MLFRSLVGEVPARQKPLPQAAQQCGERRVPGVVRIRQQLRQTMVVCALACVMLLVCCLWSAEPTYAKTNAATASGSCAVLMRWPLNGAQVVGKYDAPKQQWLPGHRGVDLLADPQEAIVAPADGVFAFSGNVGGKAVVTIRQIGRAHV